MITLPHPTELSAARARIAARLEQEYEAQTEYLAGLVAPTSRRHRRVERAHPDRHSAAIVTARRALADVAQALRRLADGSYGRCEHCLGDIPLADLEISPAARCCRTCGTAVAY